MSMPKQKPGKSKQDYTTPPELIQAICNRLMVPNFRLDAAASHGNAVCANYYTEAENGLERPWLRYSGWNWCNPPFANIYDWVAKANAESAVGAHSVVLIPASVGSDWWRECVEPFAYIVFLHGRLTFGGTPINPKTGKPDPYPKDCALLFYTPWGFRGSEIWSWRRDVPELHKPEPSEDQGLYKVPDMSLETGL